MDISRAELFSDTRKKYILSDNRYIKSYLENFGNSKITNNKLYESFLTET